MELEIIKETEVAKLLEWYDCVEAVKQALISVLNQEDGPISSQTIRTGTVIPEKNGVLLTMPGYIGNYPLNMLTTDKNFSTLSCKMISVFPTNQAPLPSVVATLFLFNSQNGQLKALIEATGITAWRTAAVSLVATEFLYFNRVKNPQVKRTLAILGTGEQGRAHAIGFLTYFSNRFEKLKLWNRTKSKAEKLQSDLRKQFPGIEIVVVDDSKQTVADADVVVTTTNTSTPLFALEDLKETVHLNPIGTNGIKFFPELHPNIYESDRSKVFVESWKNADNELVELKRFIIAEVGGVITGQTIPDCDVTIFQSVGNALEDAAVGEMIYGKFMKNKN